MEIALTKLHNAGLQFDIKKCQFEATEVKYLGIMNSKKGIMIDPQKVEFVKA